MDGPLSAGARRKRALPGLALLALTACAAPLQGVVVSEGPGTQLVDLQGRSWRLWLPSYSAPVASLDLCTVEVSGPRIGPFVRVTRWEVLAAADGSAPFVGRLESKGSTLLLHDRQTGSTFILDGDAVPALRAADGQLVLIIGFVTAPHVVRVMGSHVLEE